MPTQGIRQSFIAEPCIYPYRRNISYGILIGILRCLLIQQVTRVIDDEMLPYLLPYSIITTVVLYLIIDPVPATIQGIMAFIYVMFPYLGNQ